MDIINSWGKKNSRKPGLSWANQNVWLYFLNGAINFRVVLIVGAYHCWYGRVVILNIHSGLKKLFSVINKPINNLSTCFK